MNARDAFAPTRSAALARLAAVQPDAYARTRNHLNGAVTRLSPYLTHGFLTLHEVVQALSASHPLTAEHKLVFELGWRAYFHHVWRHRGEAIFHSLHAGPLPESAYATVLPEDVRHARSGVPVIDQAVRTLYAQGWLHNHARMWLASYLVHMRKVHWRAGADWMYAHLLDGDLASNHLSWQWVAGTGSTKPYLFNAENVARYAPSPWHSPGTLVDAEYATLDRLCRTPTAQQALPRRLITQDDAFDASSGLAEPAVHDVPPPSAVARVIGTGIRAPDPAWVAGRDVWLVHPWALRPAPSTLPPGAVRLAVLDANMHRRWPWSERRWGFVLAALAPLSDQIWWSDTKTLAAALAGARSVRAVADLHLSAEWGGRVDWEPVPALFEEAAQSCGSFSQWWRQVRVPLLKSQTRAPAPPWPGARSAAPAPARGRRP